MRDVASCSLSVTLLLTMPRPARLDAPNTLHHVMMRGLERRAIFTDDVDRADFVARQSIVRGDVATLLTLLHSAVRHVSHRESRCLGVLPHLMRHGLDRLAILYDEHDRNNFVYLLANPRVPCVSRGRHPAEGPASGESPGPGGPRPRRDRVARPGDLRVSRPRARASARRPPPVDRQNRAAGAGGQGALGWSARSREA